MSRSTRWKVTGLVVVLVAVAAAVGVGVSTHHGKKAVGAGPTSPVSSIGPTGPAGGGVATDGSLTCKAGTGSTVTSWIGNTYGGAGGLWIQPGIQGLWAAPDGTVYGETIFNEGARELRGYRNGRPFGQYTYQHAADIPNGGVAVTGDAQYVYAAVRNGNVAGVMRYHHDLTPAPFAGGTDPQGAVLAVSHTYEFLTALATGNGRLYVADPVMNIDQNSSTPSAQTVIRIYDTADLAAGAKETFSAPRARGIAVDGAGDLWVLQQGDDAHPSQITRYSSAGKPTGQVITTVGSPSSIAIDTSGGGTGRLVVTDNGPDQDVKFFGGLDGTPSLVQTLGVTGGVNAGPVQGAVGPGRLNGPAAVAVDGAGNVDVVSSGTPSFAVQGYGQGDDLQSYSSKGALRWEVYAQKYQTVAGALDESTGVDVWGTFDHYQLDLSKPVGRQWTRVGWTLDAQKYPHDPRTAGSGSGPLPSVPTARTLDGHTFLFYGNGSADTMAIYRFEPPSETAIPSGVIDPSQALASPTPGEFIWRDVNGDGDPLGDVAAEYSHPTDEQDVGVNGWFVDDAGDVWQATSTSIREFLFGGLDKVGNPIYSFRQLKTYPLPAPFTDLRRVDYDPATDTMVMSGYTAADPAPSTNQHDYKFAGSVLASYPHFTRDSAPKASWTTALPYAQIASDAVHKPITLTVAGDYVFVGYFTGADNQLNSDIHIFDARTGAPAGVLAPDATIGGRSGNTDLREGTDAYQTKGGGYLVFDEDDLYAKTIMYEWCPAS